ncbi:hypothetical protein RFI_30878 [Reticulomyxa filosa]|uniref:Uncharacterized protein n=1 Tax=Reticulomyxa filosa TaxID=46433 RepID=X6LZE5_RETFI|nr:hypothetical protein RFI_30878 [Reticulomyxa filosa]|eukprot:ETO06517.1 hypothetical protein RFI_30878 [Reticulomyxa filosa]
MPKNKQKNKKKRYKRKELERLKEMHDTICRTQKRRELALKVLPLRLSLVAQVSHKPNWKELIANNVLDNKKATETAKLFPAKYEEENINTQPAYVRSLFDYHWTEGMKAPMYSKRRGPQEDSLLSTKTDRSVYGIHQQMQLGNVFKAGLIFLFFIFFELWAFSVL